ncbi:hypothetical protein GCM10007304_03340 [Rhodococcoides trifolii]|uniref:Sensor domain-containing protein n=1 Tax=Rhodococcoides trifolii TaxID=908250 RepID=A0A917CMT9_9NOCA|nr:hypothetical protein [Rhodococcus trifolii]GGF92844.1 hypothetical protein GCM10007304_03340 [Rhodococcus trifolii]
MRTGWIVPIAALSLLVGCSAGTEIEGSPKVEGSQSDPPSLAELLPDESDYPMAVSIETATKNQLVEGTGPSVSAGKCNDILQTANDSRRQLFESADDLVGNAATSEDTYFSTSVIMVDGPDSFGMLREFVDKCPSTELPAENNASGSQKAETLDLPKVLTDADGVTDTFFAQFDVQDVTDGATTSSTSLSAYAVVDGVSVYVDSTYATGVSNGDRFTPLSNADRGQVADLLSSLVNSISTTS